jgi:hypothetical protein
MKYAPIVTNEGIMTVPFIDAEIFVKAIRDDVPGDPLPTHRLLKPRDIPLGALRKSVWPPLPCTHRSSRKPQRRSAQANTFGIDAGGYGRAINRHPIPRSGFELLAENAAV